LVRVFDANKEPIASVDANPHSEGWLDVSLSSEIELDSDFYVALEYTMDEKPGLGWSEGPAQRSYYYGTGGLNIFFERTTIYLSTQLYGPVWNPLMGPRVEPNDQLANYMIRAVVRTGYQLQVISPYGGTSGSGCYAKGNEAKFSAPDTIDLGPGKRAVFVGWKGDYQGSTLNDRVTMTKPATIEATYEIQYELKVFSKLGNPQGSGWYDQNSAATFSVEDHVLGPTGVDYMLIPWKTTFIFERWSGDSAATTATASITMDDPKTVIATWQSQKTSDYTMIYMMLGAIGAAIFLIAALVLLVRRRKGPPPVAGSDTRIYS
jgi:hypothetical protein